MLQFVSDVTSPTEEVLGKAMRDLSTCTSGVLVHAGYGAWLLEPNITTSLYVWFADVGCLRQLNISRQEQVGAF